MTQYWKKIKDQIRQTPMPKVLNFKSVTDVVESSYGKFRVVRCMTLENFPDRIENEKMYKGELLDWKLRNGKSVVAFLKGSELHVKITKEIYCNDCEKKSIGDYHFKGIECKHCGSFNTQS
jgi:hypothetical protein